jgi:hypothetical protein
LRDAPAFMTTHLDAYFSAEVHRLMGRCLIARGDRQAGEACFRAAIGIARGQGAVMLALRAARDLAAHRRGQGLPALAHALSALPEPSDWPDVVEGRQMLRG